MQRALMTGILSFVTVLTLLTGWTSGVAMAADPGLVDSDNWRRFQTVFIRQGGRVVDNGNNDISHSEGQGVGMLIAEAQGDRATFDRLWGWTKANLQVRDDALFAWKWTESSADHVPDHNNATDGDIFIAWSLTRAAKRWPDGSYQAAAATIAGDIRKKLGRVIAGQRYLIAGATGFEHDDVITVNLSYWIFPALRPLMDVDPSSEWDEIQRSGLTLLDKAKFGRWKLPADWMTVKSDGSVSLAPDHPARFGYDAVRVPLYLVWSGLATDERLKSFVGFWSEFGNFPFLPAWTNLTDDSIASYGGSAGYKAVAELTRVAAHKPDTLPQATALDDKSDYYSSTLSMMVRMAILANSTN